MDFRLRDFFYPWQITQLKGELDKSQWRHPRETERVQLARLKAILAHAGENVPYYRESFQKAGFDPKAMQSVADLEALPTLNKDVLRQEPGRFISVDYWCHRPMLSSTSGSTGTPLEFYLDKHTQILEFANVWRHWNWAGYRFGDKFADLRGRVIRGATPWNIDLRLRSLSLSSFRLGPSVVDEYIRQLKRYKPRMIRGYPSSISLFCSWLQQKGEDGIRPVCVVTSSETLLQTQRKVIEDTFGCKVYDHYGQMERVASVGECEAGNHHIFTEYGVVELLDSAGLPVEEGKTGEIVATTLWNRAMPLVRYRTRDFAVRRSGRCPCGRTLPLIGRIVGRIEDFVITPDGRWVGRLDAAFRFNVGIRMSQIVQESVDRIIVRIVPAKCRADVNEASLVRGLRERLGELIGIELQYAEDIPLTREGKFKFVDSRLSNASLETALGSG